MAAAPHEIDAHRRGDVKTAERELLVAPGAALTQSQKFRYVGKKVFLQGGVALNHAVGHAFAHSIGRDVATPKAPSNSGLGGITIWRPTLCAKA